ncbi:hypothetical protein LEAN103870_11940 [Legionella anisa]|uniref:Uncharacterized protein n=1 Tax=Legionella anisa TaxID=28082 RepID=A0AAX0WUE1_9GAMM|nr:hypothetical protein [Legionella anisa]AWN75202.1 hypothetical protein DLD14_15940 [Legionella anisa]KTC72616.1 hypothetical protein Lani_0840 [Legionella anisa]MBN5936808.1 hypothetical protein [Legionella anisa]MCW8424575.1 hypothetical protein [Legionella anisa]MCW8446306.1 hypothetical protein [Legionella anisa]
MKYTVTFCVFDHTIGGNPFWHGSFFLSKLDESKRLLEVVETWGFYGVTSTGDKNSRLEKFKIKNHLDVDFQGNHGMLINEEIRYMDLGHGLHGYTFELTQEQFEEVQRRCATAVAGQKAAISEVVGDGNNFTTDPEKKGRIYKEEVYSRQIYEIEQIKAKIEGRPSRLKPFDFHLSLGYRKIGFLGFDFWLPVPSLENSNTCKTRAVSLLEGILTEEQLAPFKNSSLPRFIPGLEPILLHSEGTLRPHTKSSGQQVFSRNWKDKDVKLYWSVPPQSFDKLAEDTVDLFNIDAEYRTEVKYIVGKLQRLEWAIRNASLSKKYQEDEDKDYFTKYKNDLADLIVTCYREFATIEPKKDTKISGWKGFALSLFSAPRSKEEKKLQAKIHQAKMLFNSIYMAIVDEWIIDKDYPSETYAPEDAEDYNPLEAVASYLSKEDKKNLCKIIGRNYIESEEAYETSLVTSPA